jgi:3',5'-cyclic AMP phosphodiesterase CpdA
VIGRALVKPPRTGAVAWLHLTAIAGVVSGAACLSGGDYAAPGGGGSTVDGGGQPPALLGAPLLFAPTTNGFGISVVVAAGDPAHLDARVRVAGATVWGDAVAPEVRAVDVAQWRLGGLDAGTRYEYRIVASPTGAVLYEGSAMTQRLPGASFSFAVVSDTHIGANLAFANQGDPATLSAVSAQIGAAGPDFMVNLGDTLDFHEYGFNDPPPDGSITRLAYLNYRTLLAGATAHAAHFNVLGGWDSENGCDTPDEINRSRDQRLRYLPGPDPLTYPEGGSTFEDYYAFTWGDALFVMLNVFTYTPGCHLLNLYPGLADDWTLGAAQLEWLRQTLAGATAKWRFLLIHHAVGGAAGNPIDSAYGRGGGQAAQVGEQAAVHQLMRDHGAQLFLYGHDHVFTDMVVDGIHYTLPGSAGAPWKFTTAETGYATYWPDSGWARVDVTPDKVSVRFINLDGKTLHELALP